MRSIAWCGARLSTASDVVTDGYVAIGGETIAAIGQGAPPSAARLLDYGGHFILPGLVDGHMHTASAIGWPGIDGATRSAAAGGVTTCVDMALYGTIRKHGGVSA